ncbi:adenylate/guanylate cyclase domain-containing protein [Rhizobium sp. BK176]|uniref:adenylate/guanylate cyclase domain-containing protein n=1 Tax=Rhizobium sp. BK176 TaxID=2587071 RepID=UPI00216A280C|nr:adenylate/guanylate cyclase domain-containing protein [Rhizobium sp. BK176]MCS4096689.1 TolB-like protein/Flp pilus assembly protein TadD [Rhizobium sp. BK176]
MTPTPTARRFVAILAADVVGYSRLMSDDEDGALDSVRLLQTELLNPRIAAGGGHTVKLMGDGLLATFDDAASAVSTALQLQHLIASGSIPAGMKPLQIRIGINFAAVMTIDDDVFGDGVNIAARLEAQALSGGICISDTTYSETPADLREHFVDGGAVQLKNIPKPVRVWHWPKAPARERSLQSVVAVLPFRRASADTDELRVDGFTEDVISGLARFKSLSVIAASSAFAIRDKSQDLRELGRRLGANYLVSGDMRQSGSDLAVSVRMIQSDTERLLWSEKYRRTADDVFAIQDDIVKMIIANLVGQIESADYREAARRPPNSLVAYEFYLRGLVHLRGYEPDDNAKAVEMFEAAVAGDGSFALAHAYLALARIAVGGYANAPENVLHESIALARHAVKLDEGESGAHRVLGLAHLFLRDFQNAEIEFRLACKLNPSDASAMVQLGGVLARRNRIEEAVPWVEEGMRLNPYPPGWYHAVLGNLLYFRGDYPSALFALRQLPNPGRYTKARILACLSMAGRVDEAATFAANLHAEFPDLTITEFLERGIVVETVDQIEHFRRGLVGTGLPK